MKGLVLGLIIFFVFFQKNVSAQCAGNIVEPLSYLTYHTACDDDDADWVLNFEDNFDGTTLDESKWVIPYQGVLAGYTFDGWKNWYANKGTTPSKPISDNLVVENGSLKLIARKENPPISGIYQNWDIGGAITESSFNYSSGWIESKKKLSYGWYEIKCKIPKGKGFWPAFWLYDNRNGVESEIDVFEFWNEYGCGPNGAYKPSMLSKNPHFTVHSNKYHPGGNTTQCAYDLYGCASNGGVDYSLVPHKFAIYWSPLVIVWYIDDVAVYSLHHYYTFNLITGQSSPVYCNNGLIDDSYFANESWPNTDRMQVLLNFGIKQGNNDEPDAATEFPAAFEIEYFRYYRHGVPCASNVNFGMFPLDPEMYYNVVAQNMTILHQTVNSGSQLDATASISVTLNPGFEAVNGSDFLAQIDPDFCNVVAGMDVNNEHQERIHNEFQDQGNSTLNIESLSGSDFLKVYPNPTSDQLTIELTTSSRELNLIEITDNQGRSLLSDTRELNEPMNLDLSTFSSGTYFIKILNKQTGKVYLERFTKKD